MPSDIALSSNPDGDWMSQINMNECRIFKLKAPIPHAICLCTLIAAFCTPSCGKNNTEQKNGAEIDSTSNDPARTQRPNTVGTQAPSGAASDRSANGQQGSPSPSSGLEISPYEVIWDTPSPDWNGSMPLGNGEVGINAWIDPSGDLNLLTARTDAWDDYGRLVKVGGLKLSLSGKAGRSMQGFRQHLNANTATISAEFGEEGDRVEFRLWVDANRPVVYVEATTQTATTATVTAEIWRKEQVEQTAFGASDVLVGSGKTAILEPDKVFSNLTDGIGWYHRNIKSVGPELSARIQGVADFPRLDPLLHRTFGMFVVSEHAEPVNDTTLRSKSAKRHLFEIAVHTKHPGTAMEWLEEARNIIAVGQQASMEERRALHEQWWSEFWNRSWIHIKPNGREVNSIIPAADLPLMIGPDETNPYPERFGRVGVYPLALAPEQIEELATGGPRDEKSAEAKPAFSKVAAAPSVVPDLSKDAFEEGLTIEAWIKHSDSIFGRGRIVKRMTPWDRDGFQLDVMPDNKLRLIVGDREVISRNVLKQGDWQHVAATATRSGSLRLYLNGKLLEKGMKSAEIEDGDDAHVVSRAYALQRFMNACAGRGNHPIKFNGSLFTVPTEGRPFHADYRKHGGGYWWQNVRLPYYSMYASGDFDMMEPLFDMYARRLMPLFRFRSSRHVDHEGTYIPETVYFWGDLYNRAYGWQPYEERSDKLQSQRFHKWEWVAQTELLFMMLERYEHTNDKAFLSETLLPITRELLIFFDQHYEVGPDGKLVMYPAQALETWWDCKNPMPEVAGLHAVTSRLLSLPEELTNAEDRAFWRQLQAKLPDLPIRTSPDEKPMLAPAEKFATKKNIENPELYAVFPFRLVSFENANKELGIEALKHRLDRGPSSWNQGDLFIAYLGLPDLARSHIVARSRLKHEASRFPVFWGIRNSWVPDQDQGSILLAGLQAMLLQSEGRKIFLAPAWPDDWDCDFKLHAPFETTLEGRIVDGRVKELKVTPESRRKDVIIPD
jgi:hypothetical protein